LPIVIPPEQELWQGDIFWGVPWSVINTADFLQPTGNALKPYSLTTSPQMGQRGNLVVASGSDLAMLISHECVVDKGGRAPLSFVRILPITTHREEQLTHIRNGANLQTFHIEANETVGLSECYADFRLVSAIDPTFVRSLRRVASLTEEGRNSLRQQLILYWTRLEPRPLQQS
jgi:hypothetical protein